MDEGWFVLFFFILLDIKKSKDLGVNLSLIF